MIDYENMHYLEVKSLAKQGDNEALYEMVFRYEELLPACDKDNHAEIRAWQYYWYEKAADAGNLYARYEFAKSLINVCIMNVEDRLKAMIYFQSLANDLDTGKFRSENEREFGIIAKLWLGIMLCEGYHTPHDPLKGAALIETADTLTNGFTDFGIDIMIILAELYASGLAQPNNKKTSEADLLIAVKYINTAFNSYNSKKDDIKKIIFARRLLERIMENTNLLNAKERRIMKMEISDSDRLRLEADKAALARLRQRLAMEGWDM